MKLQDDAVTAFSLVEVAFALGVAAVSLLVIFSLLPIGLQINQRSLEQTASVDILSSVVADLRATAHGVGTSTQFVISIPANPVTSSTNLPPLFFNATGGLVPSADDARYRLTITFLNNGGAAKTATFANLKVTWPASAAVANAQGSAEMFTAFDRN
jgi:uncharacterized protein (TIGR02598 family)